MFYFTEDYIVAPVETNPHFLNFFIFSLSKDISFPRVMIVPVPVPVYIPVPMNMYSQCTPKPVGLPVPVRRTLQTPLVLEWKTAKVKSHHKGIIAFSDLRD